jgi:hypothetical protein
MEESYHPGIARRLRSGYEKFLETQIKLVGLKKVDHPITLKEAAGVGFRRFFFS